VLYSKGLLTNSNSECFSLVLDKVDMHQAFDLDADLLELLNTDNFPKKEKVVFRTIFTTNSKGDDSK